MKWRQKTLTVEKRTILFVDDDDIILRSLERGFFDEPYFTLFAKSGQEALEILQREEVHVIVTDMRMPEMDGVELLKIVREMSPHIVMIVLSGYMDMSIFQKEFNQREIFKIVHKPWKLETDFKKVVLKAVEHYNLQSERDAVRQKNLRSVKPNSESSSG